MLPVDSNLIDDILPQTQCGLCSYGACKPYADALSQGQAPINLCPPGGITTLKKLADLLNQDAAPYLEEMEKKSKPVQSVSIRENECIGCTKCIAVCPVDAIIGSAKHMHSIIQIECTGCELCIPACPVDCIDLHVEQEEKTLLEKKEKSNRARMRYQAREKRITLEKNLKQKMIEQKNIAANKQKYIADAIARVKLKKT
jgi:electron transport complex protein RnfB